MFPSNSSTLNLLSVVRRTLFRPSKLTVLLYLSLILGSASSLTVTSEAAEKITVGTLKFGSVDWLVDVIKANKLDVKEGITVETLVLASNNAASVALLGNQADVVLGDWFWALDQRAVGEDFLFAPYSAAMGAIVVPPDSRISSLAELKGKKLGVAGGAVDESWLLLRAYGLKTGLGEFSKITEPVFAAPPLLNQQIKAGQLPAVLNFWNYVAPLEGAGYKRIIGVSSLIKGIGLDTTVPLLGFIFRQSLADKNPGTVAGFMRAVLAAQNILLKSDAEWDRLRPKMQVASDAEFQAMRRVYREGALLHWGTQERDAAAKLFSILTSLGGSPVVRENVKFDNAVFWGGLVY
jgi:NitT/TauT family transport system substrate-binding protein